MATHTTKGKSTDVWRQTRRRHSSSVVVIAHHNTAEREGPHGLAVVAQPHLPRVRAREGWVVMDCRAFGGGGDIVVWGGWDV